MRKRKPFFSRDCPWGGKLAIHTTIFSSTQESCCEIHIGPNPQSAFCGILRNFPFENKLKVSLHFQNYLNISDNPIFGNAEQFGLWGCDGIMVLICLGIGPPEVLSTINVFVVKKFKIEMGNLSAFV